MSHTLGLYFIIIEIAQVKPKILSFKCITFINLLGAGIPCGILQRSEGKLWSAG